MHPLAKEITLQRLRNAHGVAAELAANNPLLIPVFERIDRELQAMIAYPKAQSRLEKVVRRQREMREFI